MLICALQRSEEHEFDTIGCPYGTGILHKFIAPKHWRESPCEDLSQMNRSGLILQYLLVMMGPFGTHCSDFQTCFSVSSTDPRYSLVGPAWPGPCIHFSVMWWIYWIWIYPSWKLLDADFDRHFKLRGPMLWGLMTEIVVIKIILENEQSFLGVLVHYERHIWMNDGLFGIISYISPVLVLKLQLQTLSLMAPNKWCSMQFHFWNKRLSQSSVMKKSLGIRQI